MTYIFLLLRCSAKEGAGIHGVFQSLEAAKVAFSALALAEREMVEAFLEQQTGCSANGCLDCCATSLMRLDWDDDGDRKTGWAIRKVALNQLYTDDVGLTPPLRWE